MSSTAMLAAEGRLHNLLLEHRGTAIFERVKLYVLKFSGGKMLSAYLTDPAIAEDDKLRVVSTLLAILTAKDYSRLPELPVMENANAAPSVPGVPLVPVTERDTKIAESDEDDEEDDAPLTLDEIKAIARKEARAELADVLERVAKVLRENA